VEQVDSERLAGHVATSGDDGPRRPANRVSNKPGAAWDGVSDAYGDFDARLGRDACVSKWCVSAGRGWRRRGERARCLGGCRGRSVSGSRMELGPRCGGTRVDAT
jgi:hypothetical protein